MKLIIRRATNQPEWVFTHNEKALIVTGKLLCPTTDDFRKLDQQTKLDRSKEYFAVVEKMSIQKKKCIPRFTNADNWETIGLPLLWYVMGKHAVTSE